MIPTRSKIIKAHIAVIGANIIFGLNYIIAKGIMPDFMAPRAIIFWRLTGTALLFWLLAAFIKPKAVARKDQGRLALAAFFGVALNQIMFFEGLNLTSPINASIIMVGVPILVMFFSSILLREKITSSRLMGIIMGFSGSALLILLSAQASFSGNLLGNLLVFVNASSYGLFLVLVKPLMKAYSPFAVMRGVFTWGLLFAAPFTLPLALQTDYASIPVSIWLSIGYVVVFTTFLAYLLNNYSLTAVSPTTTSAYIYLQPFLTTFVAVLLGTDQPGWPEIAASALIFTGVYFVNFKKPK